MKINFRKTRDNMRMLKLGAYARHNDLNEGTVRNILGGSYGFTSGKQFDRVVAQLRKDGYLVEEPDEVDVSTAA